MNALYVNPDGLVRSGRLSTDGLPWSEGAPTLVSRTGPILGPTDVLALLAPRAPSEDERTALCRATHAGYRVEET